MRKSWKIMAVILCLLLVGCKKPDRPTDNRFVSAVTVELVRPQQIRKWTFTEPQKMEVILYYLRSFDKKTPATSDPERYAGDQYRIELTYTDGSSRRIYQRSDRFLSESFGPWQNVDSRKGKLLYPLLENLRSDEF